MLLGVIADDFTGASDIANAISRGMAGSEGLAGDDLPGRAGKSPTPGRSMPA